MTQTAIVLLVTWFMPNQPPVSSQVEFSDKTACYAAVRTIQDDAVALSKAAILAAWTNAAALGSFMQNELARQAAEKAPTVSAVCVERSTAVRSPDLQWPPLCLRTEAQMLRGHQNTEIEKAEVHGYVTQRHVDNPDPRDCRDDEIH